MTDFTKYQQAAAQTARGSVDMDSQKTRVSVAAMGLAGETGEVVDALKKWVGHDHPFNRDEIVKEMGDVLWYLAELGTALDITLDEVAEKNEAKLRLRYPDGFTVAQSITRTAESEPYQKPRSRSCD
jgi:NTP pyrophosphatase (non-canonical NTP hydrolase)